MSKARVCAAVISVAVAICIITMTVVEWARLGCGFDSLLMAVFVYSAMIYTIWFATDEWLQGK